MLQIIILGLIVNFILYIFLVIFIFTLSLNSDRVQKTLAIMTLNQKRSKLVNLMKNTKIPLKGYLKIYEDSFIFFMPFSYILYVPMIMLKVTKMCVFSFIVDKLDKKIKILENFK